MTPSAPGVRHERKRGHTPPGGSGVRAARALRRGAAAAATLRERATSSTFRQRRWCKHQDEFLRCPASEKLLRVGNQAGKSEVGLYEVISRCQGEHPYLDVPKKPIEAWIVCASWQQSIAIQQKFWALVPKEWLDRRVQFDEAKGFRGKNPVVKFRNGSIVRFKTTKQGAFNLASATIDLVLIDELTSPATYTQLQKRVLRRGGTILITLTPVNAPHQSWVTHLQDRIQKGQIVDLHYTWGAWLFRPVTSSAQGANNNDAFLRTETGVPMDEAWCAKVRAMTPEEEAPVVLDAEWPTGDDKREIRGFSERNLFRVVPANVEFTLYGLGFDHGEKSGREVVQLVALDREGCLWVLGEVVSTGATELADDAAEVGKLVESWGLALHHVGIAVGDINSAGAMARGRTVNGILEGYFAELNGGMKPFRIEPANKAEGSVDDRVIRMNSAFAGNRIRVHEGCRRLIAALRAWTGKNNRQKDPIDALGYIFDRIVPVRQPGPQRLRLTRAA